MVIFGFMLTSQYKKISYLGILNSQVYTFFEMECIIELKIGCRNWKLEIR